MPYVAVITEKLTYIDDQPGIETPGDLLAGGIIGLIEAVIRLLGGRSGTVLIDAEVAGRAGLPTDTLPEPGDGSKGHPAAVDLRSAGFKVREIYRWFRVYGEAVRLNVGLLDLVDLSHFPMAGEDPAVMAATLYQWRRLSGRDWYGAAGDAGNDVLRGMFGAGKKRKMVKPEWWTKTGPDRKVAAELPYVRGTWHLPPEEGETHGHKFDKRRAHLAALTTTQVAGAELEYRTGDLTFDKKMSGWWCVKLADWPYPYADFMPDPAGYGPVLADGYRWLTTPTLELIAQLQGEGVYGGIEHVREAWTAPGVDVLKHLAATLRTIYDQAAGIDNEDVRESIRDSVKAAYRQFAGFWQSTQSEVQRPDWTAAMIAGNRATMFRAVWKAAAGPDRTFDGVVPLWIDTDCVVYPGGPEQIDPPPGWSMEDRLGGWRIGGDPFELKYRGRKVEQA